MPSFSLWGVTTCVTQTRTATMTADSYLGEEKVVFGLDLGTTQTAVSYVHLQDSVAPHVRLVTKWPGQEDVSGDCKVCSPSRSAMRTPCVMWLNVQYSFQHLCDIMSTANQFLTAPRRSRMLLERKAR